MSIDQGTRLLCINDSKQSILKVGNVYTALVRDGINSGKGKVHINEHKRFAFSLNRFEVLV